MNFKRKLHVKLLLLFVLFMFPSIVYAYSNKVILGGENVGISVSAKHIMIVGFYEVDGKNIASDAGFKIGDEILEVNGSKVLNIDDMMDKINDSSIDIKVLRKNKEKLIHLDIPLDSSNVLKTGIYVKDKITGIGTLTYIDPETNVFGALGHEIIEQTTNKKLEISNGKIFSSYVTSITKSDSYSPGEKNAKFDDTLVYGSIYKNDISGIFGIYEKEKKEDNYISVAKSNEIKKGKAKMLTVIDNNKVEEFDISILNIDNKSDVKNILFEITDKDLINKTNGVVSGMSGSPIIQNNKLVAAVTHVVVEDPIKGYAIFIETMLKEGDKSRE